MVLVVFELPRIPGPAAVFLQALPGPADVVIPLVQVHDAVRLADQLIHREAVLRIGLRHPETEGGLVKYAVLLPLIRHGLLRLNDPPDGAVFVLTGENQHELVPAEPEHQVARPQAGLQHGRDVLQQPVPLAVAVQVVDPLQFIDIQQHHRHLPFPLPGGLKGRLHHGFSGAAVHHLGQLIQPGLLGELAVFRHIDGILDIVIPSLPPDQTVEILVRPAGEGIHLIPHAALFPAHGLKPANPAEGAEAVHAVLQHLPANAPLRLRQPENALHVLVCIHDAVCDRIRNTDIRVQPVQRSQQKGSVQFLHVPFISRPLKGMRSGPRYAADPPPHSV